jgi:predicted ester cyclase
VSAETNKALVRRFFDEVWNQQREAAIDAYLAPDTVGNDPGFGTGREAFRGQWKRWCTAFPDLHFAVEELVAEGDVVVSRWILTGTHRGEFLGVAPTGAAIRVSGMSLDHLGGGQIVSGFDAWDELGLHRQLGLAPPAPGHS